MAKMIDANLDEAKSHELMDRLPDEPLPSGFTRRRFMKGSAVGAGLTVAACQTPAEKNAEARLVKIEPVMPGRPAESTEPSIEPPEKDVPTNLLSACPYCGVGCGTKIQVEKGKIVGMTPDRDHPTNKGLQCIKGLSSNEAIYVDRLTKPLIRIDHNDPITGHESATKGRFDEAVFREATWEEAEELIVDTIVHTIEKFGGNSIGLYGSGQLPVEGQYLENQFMKGVIGSNTIEANARMCMTSAVTGYFKTLGSDTPPTSYDDIEMADMICNWGHNCRGSHPIVFWRIADHKKQTGIPTLVVDPRRTGTVMGYEEVKAENAYHFRTINGDISIQNAMAYLMLNKYKDAVDWDLLKKHTRGWEAYVEGVQKYEPSKVADMTMVDPAYLDKVAEEWANASVKGRENGEGGVLSFWGIGYNQHLHGQNNTVSLVSLLVLTGNIGRPGCGPFSMTGQPNAMGERLTGGLTGRLPFNQGLDNVKWRDHIADSWGVPRERLEEVANHAKNPGMAIGMMERALKGEVKANFLIYATHIDLPDQEHLVRPALKKTFNVVQEIYRHAPNNLYADVILPAATWGEWVGGTYIQSERRFYVCDGTANPIEGTMPDMDMVIDKGKAIANRLGLDGDKVFPYFRKENGFYDPEDVFREMIKASKGSDADMSGMLEVEERDGIGLYDQIRQHRGIQWPAPNYEIARAGGTKRRYLGQEDDSWVQKPYGSFRHKDGKMHMYCCEQDYSQRKEITAELAKMGTVEGFYAIDNMDLLRKARDMALTPELPDFEFLDTKWDEVPDDKYPFWLGLGVVYEHFHTAKTIRQGTTRKLVPEQYVEMHPEDAAALGVEDGEWVEIFTRRSSYEARVSVGLDSVVKPARNLVPKGYLFSPWNVSVADSADPPKNRWLVNRVSHRAFDPVSGQVDFKKLAGRVRKLGKKT
jgi:anaerobic selenocysteine-containing dehydrogenase